jgi:hypothetical protein
MKDEEERQEIVGEEVFDPIIKTLCGPLLLLPLFSLSEEGAKSADKKRMECCSGKCFNIQSD